MKACIEQLDRIQKRALKIIDRKAHKDLKYIALECMYILYTSGCQKKRQHLSLMYWLSKNWMYVDYARPNIALKSRHKIIRQDYQTRQSSQIS